VPLEQSLGTSEQEPNASCKPVRSLPETIRLQECFRSVKSGAMVWPLGILQAGADAQCPGPALDPFRPSRQQIQRPGPAGRGGETLAGSGRPSLDHANPQRVQEGLMGTSAGPGSQATAGNRRAQATS